MIPYTFGTWVIFTQKMHCFGACKTAKVQYFAPAVSTANIEDVHFMERRTLQFRGFYEAKVTFSLVMLRSRKAKIGARN